MRPSKKTRQLSEDEFQRVLMEVRRDISTLQLHANILTGVDQTLNRNPRIRRNFPAFFSAFCTAIRTDLIIGLGRIYDPEGTGHKSCTLGRCLCLLRDSPHFFAEQNIRTRLSNTHPQVTHWDLIPHRLDLRQLEKDLAQIDKRSRRLRALRNKLYAHKDVDTVFSEKREDFLSTHDEVIELICLAHEIWNRYSNIWNGSPRPEKIHYADDYKQLFNYLRRGMKVKSMLDRQQLERAKRRVLRRRES